MHPAYIKTKDANNPNFVNYLQQKNYKVNKTETKFGRSKQVVQGVFSGLRHLRFAGCYSGIDAVLAFYLQLMIARSKEQLTVAAYDGLFAQLA